MNQNLHPITLSPRARAFNLVELPVVIAIITVLISLLLPLLHAERSLLGRMAGL